MLFMREQCSVQRRTLNPPLKKQRGRQPAAIKRRSAEAKRPCCQNSPTCCNSPRWGLAYPSASAGYRELSIVHCQLRHLQNVKFVSQRMAIPSRRLMTRRGHSPLGCGIESHRPVASSAGAWKSLHPINWGSALASRACERPPF